MTTYIDGHLRELAYGNDREAVRVVSAIARDHLGHLVGDDDALGWALEVMDRLARGDTVPKPARQRPLGHLVYERWVMAQRVGDVMREDGLSETAAMALVARAAARGGSRSVIYNARKQYENGELPADLFPIPAEAHKRLADFEKNLAVERQNHTKNP